MKKLILFFVIGILFSSCYVTTRPANPVRYKRVWYKPWYGPKYYHKNPHRYHRHR